MMIVAAVLPEIRELLQQRDFMTIRSVLEEWHPVEIAELIEHLEPHEQALLFRILPTELAADVFEYLELEQQKALLQTLAQREIASILNEMDPDDRTALLEELPGNVVQQLLNLLSPEEREIAQALLAYPEESVGRLRATEFVAVGAHWTVEKVLDYVRTYGKDSETLNILYVTDDQGKLIGELPIRKLLLAEPESYVFDIMNEHFPFLYATDPQEKAIEVFKEYDRVALPVIDTRGYLLGIVTVDDILDVVEEEDTEDIQKFGGMEALETSYTATPLLEMVRKRGMWLILLFVGEMFTATALGYFEHQIAQAVILALFIPLLISSGGNSGSQTATLVIRAMALGELQLGDWKKVLRRELLTGLLLGAMLGILGFMRAAFTAATDPRYHSFWHLIGFTVFLALVGIVLWGTIVGSMLPFLLRRLGLDPATSSAPFVATLVDVTGIIIYFTVANLILYGILL